MSGDKAWATQILFLVLLVVEEVVGERYFFYCPGLLDVLAKEMAMLNNLV